MNDWYSSFGLVFVILWLTLSLFLTLFSLILTQIRYIGLALAHLKFKLIKCFCKQKKSNQNLQINDPKNTFAILSDEFRISLEGRAHSEIEPQNEKKTYFFSAIINAYSIKSNVFELFCQTTEGKHSEALRIFDLLKIISCGIIIFYHSSGLRSPILPKETTTDFALIYNMGQIVDVFYWISGCLNFLSLQRRLTKVFKKPKVNFFVVFFKLIWGRIIRIYGPYFLSLIYLTSVHSHFFGWQVNEKESLLNRGSFLYEKLGQNDSCWKNFFMVADHKCMQFAWYMADDLFIYAAFVIVLYIPFHLNQKFTDSCFKGGPLIFLFVFGSFLLCQLCSFFILSQNSFSFSDYFPSLYPMSTCFNENKKYFFFFFTISPVTRYYAFIFGAIVGFSYEQYVTKNIKEKFIHRISKKGSIIKVIVYIIGIIFAMVCYYLGYSIWKWVFVIAKEVQYQADLWSLTQHFQYLLWWRFIILIGITIVILPCLLSIPMDPLRILLKIRWPFSSFSKLTYCAYLFHIYVIEVSMFLFGKNQNSLEKFIIENFSIDLLISFLVALCIYLLIEAPIRNLCKPNSNKRNSQNLQKLLKEEASNLKKHDEIENSKNFSANIGFSKLNLKELQYLNQNLMKVDPKKNVKKNMKSCIFFLVFLAFSVFLHLEIYKELIQNTNNIRGCNFSFIQNSTNCSLNINLQPTETPRIYLDTAYGVCVENCRDDRYLFTVTNSCVPQCPTPYVPSEQKHCCSPLCITCNRSNINECFTCRYFSFKSLCVLECPVGTVSDLNNDCFYCNEINSSAPYYDIKSKKCKSECNFPQVIYTMDNHSQCLENCPEGTQKQPLGNYCCDHKCEDCFVNDYRECIYKDNKACNNHTWFWESLENTCVETCPENLLSFASRKLCVENCSSIDSTMHETNHNLCCKIGCEECSFEDDKYCSKCSNDYFHFLDTHSCVFNCPLGYQFSLRTQSCEPCPHGVAICDQLNLDKWCQPELFLSKSSTCNAYCPTGTPDPKKQFCCNETENLMKCKFNQTIGICERVRLEKIYSPSMQKEIPFFLVLPKKWDPQKNESFPVVIIYHGNYNNYVRFTMNFLHFACYNEDFIIVFPDGDINTYFVDSPTDPRIRYETFITEEFRPYLIQNYRARNDRKWANVGLSSGGFASLALAMKHRDKFCAAYGFSPIIIVSDVTLAHDKFKEYRFGNKNREKDNYIPYNLNRIAENTNLQNNNLNIFFTCYHDDKIGEVGRDCREFHQYLDFKNISHYFDEREGVGHVEGWEDQIVNKVFPFILDSLKNNCE